MISWNTHVAKLYNISQMQPNNTTLQPKVSIVIPVYKVEKYIGRCVRTLFSQTLDSLEYIFVDDCTPDDSIGVMTNILEEYPERKQQVKIIRHEENKGVSKSRQDGVDAATGEYIIHCDPDDWVEPDMYERLYEKAKETEADIVICDYIVSEEGMDSLSSQNVPKCKKQLILDVADGTLRTYLWNKLIKHSFFDKSNLHFDSNISLWEDMSVVLPLMLLTEKIEICHHPLYYYCKTNSDSITAIPVSKKNTDSEIKATQYIKEYIKTIYDDNQYKKELGLLMAKAAHPLISYEMFYNPSKWREVCKDVNISELDSFPATLSAFLVRCHLDRLNLYFVNIFRRFS